MNECLSKPCKNTATCSDSTLRFVSAESWQNAIRIVRPSAHFHYASPLWVTSKPVYKNGNLLSHAYIHQKVCPIGTYQRSQSVVLDCGQATIVAFKLLPGSDGHGKIGA